MSEIAVLDKKVLEKNMKTENHSEGISQSPRHTEEDIFNNIRYICNSTSLITEALQSGWDVAQLPNGDVIVTEIVTVNVLYSWDKDKQKMVRISQG